MTELQPGGFGSKLREARERRGMTLREIANATKISMRALEALEVNDIPRLPGGIFSRGFVRSYAIEVGLDPEPLIKDFIAQFPQDSVTAGHPTTVPIDDPVADESDRRAASTFLRMILISVPIVGVILYFGMARGRWAPGKLLSKPSVADGAAPARVPEVVTRDVPSVPAAPPPGEPSPATPPAPAPLAVVLVATSRSWVTAVVDGQRVLDRQLAAGERQALDVNRDLVLTMDDPSALTLTLNGGRARALGLAGERTTARLTVTNYKNYLGAP